MAKRGAVTVAFRRPMKKSGNKARRKKRRKPIVRMFDVLRAVLVLILLVFVDGGMDAVLGVGGVERRHRQVLNIKTRKLVIIHQPRQTQNPNAFAYSRRWC